MVKKAPDSNRLPRTHQILRSPTYTPWPGHIFSEVNMKESTLSAAARGAAPLAGQHQR